MKFTAATWNCQGNPLAAPAKRELLDHLMETPKVIMLQESGNPAEWGLKDGIRGILGEWHALFCSDPAAFNLRCSVGLLIHKSIPVTGMGFVRSATTYRPLVMAGFEGGGVGSFHAAASKSSRQDWNWTVRGMINKTNPRWWLVGGDYNDDMIELMDSVDEFGEEGKEQIGAYGGITQKSGHSIDGFKYGGVGIKQFCGIYAIHPPSASGSRFSFTSDHQCLGGNFIIR